MVRRRKTVRGKTGVYYSSQKEAERAKDRAPGTNKVTKTAHGWKVSRPKR